MPPSSRFALLLCAIALAGGCAAPAPRPPAAPGAGTGRLRIASNPVGARIILDGVPTNFRTPTAFPLAAGSHRVMLSLMSHRNWEVQLRVEPGATTHIEAALPALGSGSIGVTSAPPGAQVLVDGASTGLATPTEVHELAVGTHTIQLRRDGCEDWSQAVVVRQGRHFAFHAALQPLRRNLGSLAVRTHPPRAQIVVDGAPSDRISPATLVGLVAGSHVVDLSLAGYRPWTGSVNVIEGQEQSLLVTLRRLPAQEVGSLRIESDPPGAAITLNGIPLRRKSPADIGGLPPGTFAIQLTRPGSLPWRGEVTVLPGERTLIQTRLDPLP